MTKNWDLIRREACDLYSQGWSLKAIQAHLEAEHQFKASPRAFRTKLQLWGVTRTNQLKQWRDRGAALENRSSNVAQNTNTDVEHHDDIRQATTSPLRRSTVPGADEVARINALNHGDFASQESLNGSSDDLSSPPRLITFYGHTEKLEQFYLDIVTAKSGRGMGIHLREAITNYGGSRILHFFAAKRNIYALDCVVECIQAIGLDVDMKNDRGFTALEEAILRKDQATVELLLDAGATVVHLEKLERSPLLFAIARNSSPDICRILMQREAGLDRENRGLLSEPSKVVDEAVHRLHMASSMDDKDSSCAIIEALLEHGAFASANLDSSEARCIGLIHNWKEWESAHIHRSSTRRFSTFRLGHYIRADYNPACWFPRHYCPAMECESFAAYIFAHTLHSGLSNQVIEVAVSGRHWQDVVVAALNPCSEGSYAMEQTPNDILNTLLQQAAGCRRLPPPNDTHFFEITMQHSPAEFRAAFSRTLLEFDAVTPNDKLLALELLPSVDFDAGLEIAENLLGNPGKLITEDLYIRLTQLFFHSDTTETGVDAFSYPLSDQVKALVTSELYTNERTLSQLSYDRLQSCLVHVITKLWLSRKLCCRVANRYDRLAGILELRRKHDLPEISIPSSVFANAETTVDDSVVPRIPAIPKSLANPNYPTPQSEDSGQSFSGGSHTSGSTRDAVTSP